MLVFAVGIGRHRGRILEVELPHGQGLRARDGALSPRAALGNPPILVEDAPDRAGRARETFMGDGGRAGLVEVIQNGLRARGPVEVAGRMIADLEHVRDHRCAEGRRWMGTRSRPAMYDRWILRRRGGA